MLERGTAIELLTFSVRLNLCRALSFRSFRCCLAMLSMRACFEKSLPCLNRRKALPSATDLGVDKCKLKKWRELGGDALEPVLASGAVALLDAQWIISHAEAGGGGRRRPHPARTGSCRAATGPRRRRSSCCTR